MRVAFLIDEVHRSNTDDVHQEMYSAFDELQDIFDENGGFITRGSTKKNLIVGFTATPSDRVLARFGEFHRSTNFNQLWKPFDSYTMKEAIADGYILDPTKHIIPVPAKMYFELPNGVMQAITAAMNSGQEERDIREPGPNESNCRVRGQSAAFIGLRENSWHGKSHACG